MSTKKPSAKPRSRKGARPSKARATAGIATKPSPAASSSAASTAGTSTVANAPSATGKRGRGRPTDYRDDYAEQAYKLCLLGAKDKEIAEFFGVVEATLNTWKIQHPSFLESMRAGKDQADAVIAESLYHRAKGYSHPEVHVSNYQGDVTLTPLTKHYPPDTAAASLWLRNRQPSRWRDKTDHELAGPNGGPIRTENDTKVSPSDAYLRMIGK